MKKTAKKKVLRGWCNKDAAMKDIAWWLGENLETDIWSKRRTEEDWDSGCFPPRRVKVTIEFED